MVTWMDAIEYCNYLSIMEELDPVYDIDISLDLKVEVKADLSKNGYRLPTEAEWEFAARGGLKSKGFLYAGSSDLSEVAWYSANSNNLPHPVGSKKPNELGIYDMSGNVWEWCQDRYAPYAAEAQTNPLGWSQEHKKVLRGGAWILGPSYARVYKRLSEEDDVTDYTFGFRIVRRP
jgi:formylglycine-generating enzyme required for sulfatase activity